jgi:hypothetical protein
MDGRGLQMINALNACHAFGFDHGFDHKNNETLGTVMLNGSEKGTLPVICLSSMPLSAER